MEDTFGWADGKFVSPPSLENIKPLNNPIQLCNKHVLALKEFGTLNAAQVLQALIPPLLDMNSMTIKKRVFDNSNSSLTKRLSDAKKVTEGRSGMEVTSLRDGSFMVMYYFGCLPEYQASPIRYVTLRPSPPLATPRLLSTVHRLHCS